MAPALIDSDAAVCRKARRELQEWLAAQHGLVAELARDELEDIIRVSGGIAALRRRITCTVRPVAPDLIALQGCAELTAARIVAEVAGIGRFRSEAAFARYVGLAPLPHTSGAATVRLRPTLGTATVTSTPPSTASPSPRRSMTAR